MAARHVLSDREMERIRRQWSYRQLQNLILFSPQNKIKIGGLMSKLTKLILKSAIAIGEKYGDKEVAGIVLLIET